MNGKGSPVNKSSTLKTGLYQCFALDGGKLAGARPDTGWVAGKVFPKG